MLSYSNYEKFLKGWIEKKRVGWWFIKEASLINVIRLYVEFQKSIVTWYNQITSVCEFFW